MFPGEPDVGLRLSGGVAFLRWTLGVLNGEPLDEKGYPAQDPNAAKDILLRVGVDTSPRDDLKVTGGVSVMRGKGFHAGSDATKATIEWHDANEDGIIQQTELTPIPGASATPSQNFDRWLIGADLQLAYHSRYGRTFLYGEVQVGNNMDRGILPSDPILTGVDTRQLGYYIGVVQDVTEHGLVGFRYDWYDPNSDAFDKRGGRLYPFSQRVVTYSPLVGLVVPHAKLLFQYDFIDNTFARDNNGVPARLKNNQATLRLQVEL
jgi:hypothetical protein